MNKVQEYRERLGTNLLISAPPKPLSKKLIRNISEIICDIEDIREAHFSNVLSMGSNDPAVCVLFLVFCQVSKISAVMESVGSELEKVSRDDVQFEVWPICQSDDLLETIRSTNCVIGWRD